MLNSSLSTFLRFPLRRVAFSRLLLSTNISSPNQKYKNVAAKERKFVVDTLSKYGVFQSHLFPPKPYEIPNSSLQKLVELLKEAVTCQDIPLVVELSEKIPKSSKQLEYVKQTLASSHTTSFSISLDNYLSDALSILNQHVDEKKLLAVLRLLFQVEWILPNHFDDQPSKVIAPIELAMTAHSNHLDLPIWCRFVQWRLKLQPKTSKLHGMFLTDVAPHCRNIKDMLAISYLLGEIDSGPHLLAAKALETNFEQLVKQNFSYWYENGDLAGVLCYGLSRFLQNGRTKNRQLIVFMWDMIVYIMKNDSQPELSTTLSLCLKHANNSVHAPQMMDYPYVMEKYFSGTEAICSKLCKLSPVAAVNMFRSMVLGSHVNVQVAQKVLQHTTEINWQDVPLHEFALALKTLAEYGCTDTQVYRPMIKYLLSSDCMDLFSKDCDLLKHALEGLMFLHVFPPKLHDLFFRNLNSRKLQKEELLLHAMFLDGTLSVLCPEYKGTRLNDEHKQAARQLMQKSYQHLNKDGSMRLMKKMSTSVLDCINSIPAISHRFIVQEKPALDHFRGNDIILKTPDSSVANIVVVLQEPSQFLRMYNAKRESTLYPRGMQRSKLAQLKKLGYQTVTINFQEYQQERNHSQLIKAKLKAAKVL